MKLLFIYSLVISTLAQPTPHDRWKNLFNTDIESIQQAYSSNAVLVTPDGVTLRTAHDLTGFYTKLKSSIGQIKSVTTLRQEEVTPGLSFEIGCFVTTGNKKFIHLLVGRRVNNDFVRELEILSESNGELADVEGINKARNSWMALCNNHKANELVSRVYTENAVYYNNNRVLIGTVDITKEYRYMNNPSYQLTLTPIVVEGAGKALAFEIGQCSGSYQGKYTLVWKKIGDKWKVLVDSN